MATAFNESYYLQYKLAQLTKRGEHYTEESLKAAIEKAGMTVEEHYNKYATTEGTSANPYFNTTEYLEAKLAQLNSTQEGGHSWTMSQLMDALKAAGLTAEEHYQKYGCKETDADGKLINPSNAFDANAYVAAKLYQLQHSSDAAEAAEWAGKTAMDVLNAITAHRMSPVSHYERYGSKEANADNVAMVQTVPVVDRVANDPLRAIAEDNVPSNYNKSTTAPASVSTGHVVTKPADMGGLADESVSPEVTNPESPVATPSDPEYVEVPGNGITDTNSNPVVLVEATVTDADGNEVKVAQYGVETSNGNVQPVTDNGTVDRSADPIQTTSTANGVTTTTVNVTDGENTIKETTTEQADGAKTTSTEATLSDGSTVKGTAETTVASNGVATTETTATVTKADGTSVTTEATVVESGNRTTTEGTTTTKDSDGNVTGTTESKVVATANANGSTTVKTDATVKDANGKTVETVSETATTSKASDGTTTTTTRGTSTDANGNVTKTSETVTANRDAATGTTTTDTNAKTTNPDGNTVTSQNTETVATAADGTTTTQSIGTTTTKDAQGNTSTVATEATKVENPDGSGTETSTTTATAADGSTVETTSSSATTVAEDGTKTTESKTEAVAKDADGATTSTTTTEAKTTENTDGTSKTETTAVTENADGSKEEVKTEETVNADGSSEKTTETTTTDASGKSETSTETEKTDANGNTSTDNGGSGSGGGSSDSGSTADTTKPTATVTFDDATNTFTVKFSEKVSLVDGKTLADAVSLSDGTSTVDLTSATISELSTDGTTFTVAVSSLAAGNYTLTVAEGTVKDAAGNTNAAVTSASLPNTESGGSDPATEPTFSAESVTLDEAKLADGSGTGSGSATGAITVQNADKLYVGTNEVTSTGILLDASGNVTMTESEGVVKVAYASETLTYTLLKASSASSINVPLSTESGGTAVKTIAVTVTDDAPVGSDVSATVDLSDVTDALKFELTDLATAAKYGADKAASSDPFSAQAGTGSVGTITYENGKYYYNLTADQVTALKSSAASEAATESFTYTLKDGDGTSSSVANIVISVKGSAAATVTPDFTSATQTAAVYEAALDSGSGAASGQSATASGEFVLTAAPEASSAPTVKVGSGTAEALTASAAKTITGDGFTATFTWDGSTKIAYTYTQTAKATNASNADATNAFTVAVGDKSSTLTVSVKDDKPVVTAGETTALTQTAGATTASNIATVKFGADDAASSEPVTFAVTNSESTAVTGEDLTALGISYDATDKVVTFQPTASAAAGTYSVTITAKDGDGSTTEQTVTVTVSEAAADTHAAVTAATTTPSFTIGATDPIVLGTVDFGTDGAPTEFSADSISVKVGDVAKTATWDATNSKWTVEGVGDFSVKQQSSTSVYDIQFKPSATEAAESASVTVSFKDADDTEFADGVALSYKVEAASTTSDPVITATFASNTLTLNNIAEKTASNQIVVDLGVTDADKIVNDGGADITISGDAAAAAIHSIDVSSLAAEKGVKITNANGLSWTGTDGEEAISIKADSAKSIVDVMLTDGKTDLVTSTEGLSEGGVIPVHLIGDLSTGDVVTGFVEIGSLDDTTGTFTTAVKTGSTTTTLKMTAGDTYTLSGTAAGVSFEGDAAQNISVTNTCANGNVDLGNGNDTLTLTASVDTGVSMGAGADALTIAEETNRTAKVAVYEGRAGVAATSIKTSSNGEVTQFATGDKIAFENGVDTVDGFLKANDSIGFMTNSENTTISELATLTEKTAANLSAGVYVGYGSYDSTSKTFTLADSYSNDNDDALVFHVDSANTSFTGESGVDSAVVLIGVDGTLTTDNFTVTSMSNG